MNKPEMALLISHFDNCYLRNPVKKKAMTDFGWTGMSLPG